MKKLKILLILLLFMPIYLKAASSSISVSSSANTVVVGKTFNIYVKISSSTALGSWEWTIDYDSNKYKLLSGPSLVADYGDGSKTSASYTYSFKAIGSGSGSIGVKAYGSYAWDESALDTSANSKTVKVISQSELEASYSKNNNASNISIDNLSLSPEFNKDTLEYTCEAPNSTESININVSAEDGRSSISGDGYHEVSEGENKFEIIITAENGSTKTYTLTVNVVDPNPIKVNINNKELTVVKRASLLSAPLNYEQTTIKINEQDVPAFTNELNKYTLVGLKDNKGNINLYIYDNKTNKYTLYTELNTDQLKIMILPINMELEGYTKTKIKINDNEYEALKMDNSDFTIIYARNLDTAKNENYIYDTKTNTVIRYTEDNLKTYKDKLEKYKNALIILIFETFALFIITISLLISKQRKRKKKIKMLEEQKRIENERRLEEERLEQERKEKEEKNKQEELKKNKNNKNEHNNRKKKKK